MNIRVLIADDHPVVRDGLRFSIERSGAGIEVVAEAATGLEALKHAEHSPADVYILDITMPELNGIETARELLRRQPSAKVIMLSFHSSRGMVEQALAAGARGYLTKETATKNVVEAVHQVRAGFSFLSPDVAHLIVGEYASRDHREVKAGQGNPLTAQERRVLQLIAEGLSNKQIAAKLDRSENTIHAHRNRLMAKLGLRKGADLVRYAIREGIAKL
ncbi:MAG TPA: DNA-binding response regulator [Syntrophobacteraceae bacterium]|nr:DNA-binding response regulator [Syntrophobacteraceae bacterium]